MARAADIDIELYLGDDETKVFAIKNAGVAVNLTGRTYRAIVRENPASFAPIVEFAVVNGGATGLVTCSLTHTQTAAITTPKLAGGASEHLCWYDLQETSGANLVTVARGRCNLKRNVTR